MVSAVAVSLLTRVGWRELVESSVSPKMLASSVAPASHREEPQASGGLR
jgi:hypothetical protein